MSHDLRDALVLLGVVLFLPVAIVVRELILRYVLRWPAWNRMRERP